METAQKKLQNNPAELEVFRNWLEILNRARISYLLGGAFAVYLHTGSWRDTKDMDVFLQAKDLKRALRVFEDAGYQTEIRARNWLAKVFHGPYFLDLIFGFWNGRLSTIHRWLERSKPARFAGVTVPLISLEDLIYSKIYIAARDRFDGADIAHLIKNAKKELDWKLVLDQLGEDSPLLLWQLILYDFIYPGHLRKNEQEMMVQLFEEVVERWSGAKPDSNFRGPLMDPFSFKPDMEEMGYRDPRDMTPLVDSEGNVP